MVNISYHRLFNLKVSHDYYKDGLAKGIHLKPSQKTAAFLKNSRMLFKKLAHQNVVLFRTANENPPVNPPNPFIALEEDFRLTFALTIENLSTFINITDLDVSPANQYQSSNILYFINNPANASDDPTAPESLNHELLDSIRNSMFSYFFSLSPSVALVDLYVFSINDDGSLGSEVSVGKDVNGIPLLSPRELPEGGAGNGSYNHLIDLRSKPNGRYRIIIVDQGDDPSDPGNILRQETIYVDDTLVSQSVIGIVDVVYQAPSTGTNAVYKTTEEYNIQFARKQTFWKYIVVGKTKGVDVTTYAITDKGADVSPYDVNTFEPISAPPVIDDFVNGKPAKIYRSTELIDLFETPKLAIELKGDGGVRKIANLPNASPNSIIKKNEITSALESEIYVFL